MPPTARVD